MDLLPGAAMTYAPASLRNLAAYYAAQGGVNLGVVGDAQHTKGYHLGRDRIYGPDGEGGDDYSIQSARDRAGLSDAASALDLGKLDGSLDALRRFTVWLGEQVITEAPDARDVRDVIGSPDGAIVKCWIAGAAGGGMSVVRTNCADSGHLTHTHISYFRDSRARDKQALFQRYLEGIDTMNLTPKLRSGRGIKVEGGHAIFDRPVANSAYLIRNTTAGETLPLLGNQAGFQVVDPDAPGGLAGYVLDRWVTEFFDLPQPGTFTQADLDGARAAGFAAAKTAAGEAVAAI